MRCNYRLFYLKLKNVLLLLIVFTVLILLITLFTHSPYMLRSYSFKKVYKYSPPVPGSFLDDYKSSNVSYCKFNYNLPEALVYHKAQLAYTPDLGKKSPYRVLYNVIEATSSYNSSAGSVTYSTHVTTGFVDYVPEIIKAWEGPVSVAAFVPDFDGASVLGQLVTLCRCLPEMAKVSVHFVFPFTRPPFVKTPHSEGCSAREPSNKLSYRSLNRLPYPINACRNVARNAATTRYILTSDVELMPSEFLATSFLSLYAGEAAGKAAGKVDNEVQRPSRVFVVPVFEVDVFEAVPRNKQQLLQLVKDEKAVYFHRHVCSHCQKFPGLEKWLQTKEEDVKPLLTVKREYPYHRWEPIYIGTNEEPFYSELLSWEGKQDKMTQVLEMCLIGYRFTILDGVFLVHWPGIKKKSIEGKIADNWRSPYIIRNSRQYSRIIGKFSRKYAKRNPKCKMQ